MIKKQLGSGKHILTSRYTGDIQCKCRYYPSNVHGGTGFVGISTESGKVFQLMDKDVSYDY